MDQFTDHLSNNFEYPDREASEETTQINTMFDSNGLEVRAVISSQLNTTAIINSIGLNERSKEYIVFAMGIARHLPENEKIGFMRDPINFTSDTLLFRGLTSEKYAQLKSSQVFPVQAGDYGAGNGVAFSNRPYAAFT